VEINQEDHGSKANPGKKFGHMSVFPTIRGSTNRRIIVQAHLTIKQNPIIKVPNAKMAPVLIKC
jgi:hypothetical protein